MTNTPSTSTQALGEFTVTRIFNAPRELVFKAMIDPEQLTRFWGPVGTSTPLDKIKIDPRPGGVFETVMVDDATGAEFPSMGVYLEVIEPERLCWKESGIGLVSSSTFTDLGDGRTEVVIHQTNVPEQFLTPETQAGFNSSLDRFAEHLASLL
jgi:uncharacterized protein YndB with AHSA1/START domain